MNTIKKALLLTQRLDHSVTDDILNDGKWAWKGGSSASICHSTGNQEITYDLDRVSTDFVRSEEFQTMPLDMQQEVTLFIENRETVNAK